MKSLIASAQGEWCTRQSIIPDLYEGVRKAGSCEVQIDSFSDIATLLLNGVSILLSMSGLVAVGFIIYGSFKYITSSGDSGGIKSARDTILNAVSGLVIILAAFGAVRFISGQF